jgi:hypothetical protein
MNMIFFDRVSRKYWFCARQKLGIAKVCRKVALPQNTILKFAVQYNLDIF